MPEITRAERERIFIQSVNAKNEGGFFETTLYVDALGDVSTAIAANDTFVMFQESGYNGSGSESNGAAIDRIGQYLPNEFINPADVISIRRGEHASYRSPDGNNRTRASNANYQVRQEGRRRRDEYQDGVIRNSIKSPSP